MTDPLRLHRRLKLLARLFHERGITEIEHPFYWNGAESVYSGYTRAKPIREAAHTPTPMPRRRPIWRLLDDCVTDMVPIAQSYTNRHAVDTNTDHNQPKHILKIERTTTGAYEFRTRLNCDRATQSLEHMWRIDNFEI